MALSILDPLVDKAGGVRKSANWYRNAIGTIANRVTRPGLMRSGKLLQAPSVGRLNMFFYDPKYKQVLPYYDRFPLVLPLERISGGFSGINFHYLPPVARFRLLEQLQRYATSSKISSRTTFDVSYDRVKRIPLVKNTIKKYLFAHVRSNFLKIDFDESALAIYLPVQQFKKGRPY